jgi:hypothetical protein
MRTSSDPQPQELLLALLQLLPSTHQIALTLPELSPPADHNHVLQQSTVQSEMDGVKGNILVR